MNYTKLKVYYQGDGNNVYGNTTSQLEKKYTITLPVQAKKYGDANGYENINVTFSADHLILKGSNGEILFDRDINGENNNEYITKITRFEWIGEDYVEPKPLNKYTKIKVYHNWQGDGRTLTLPLSKECIEYGDRYGYDKIKVSKTGWEFAMENSEGGTMIYKSFLGYDVNSGIGKIIKLEWLNAQIESDIKRLKNKYTKLRVNHGSNSKMTISLPKKLTEFGDRFGYDKITFARKGCSFFLYDPDGFILLRKDCYETGLGEIKSLEWLDDKSGAVSFKPAPAPFEIPVEEPAPVMETTPDPVEESLLVMESTPKPVEESLPVMESTPEPVEKPMLIAEPKREPIVNSIHHDSVSTCNINSKLSNKGLLKRAFSLNGRIGRVEYIISWVIFLVGFNIIEFVESIGIALDISETMSVALLLPFVVLVWFIIAQNTKRCHDIGKSGWYQLIPYYIVFLIFAKGNSSTNKYGNNIK